MRSYLEIAMRVRNIAPGRTRPIEVSSTPFSRVPRLEPLHELPECGSPDCAGCYHVAEDTRIHPPRCGKDWLANWKPVGKAQ